MGLNQRYGGSRAGDSNVSAAKVHLLFKGQRLEFSFEALGKATWPYFCFQAVQRAQLGTTAGKKILGSGHLAGFQDFPKAVVFKLQVHQHHLEDLLKHELLGVASSFSFRTA